MMVRYFLLTLPVHRRSFQRYYAEHDREVESLRPEIEKEWGQSFDDIPPHIRLYWQDQWYWPPWFFNDSVAYVRIGSDGKDGLHGDLFLKRRHFPPTAPEKFSRRGGGPQDEEEIVYLASIGKHAIDPNDNATYIVAIEEILTVAQETVRSQGQDVPEACVWTPGYELSCIDFAAADRQLRERFPERAAGD